MTLARAPDRGLAPRATNGTGTAPSGPWHQADQPDRDDGELRNRQACCITGQLPRKHHRFTDIGPLQHGPDQVLGDVAARDQTVAPVCRADKHPDLPCTRALCQNDRARDRPVELLSRSALLVGICRHRPGPETGHAPAFQRCSSPHGCDRRRTRSQRQGASHRPWPSHPRSALVLWEKSVSCSHNMAGRSLMPRAYITARAPCTARARSSGFRASPATGSSPSRSAILSALRAKPRTGRPRRSASSTANAPIRTWPPEPRSARLIAASRRWHLVSWRHSLVMVASHLMSGDL